MAKGNMILTLVAQTKQWAQGLDKAAQQVKTWGRFVGRTMKFVSAAFLGVAGAIITFLPNFIKMGEEARKSERRLRQIAENTGLFEQNLDGVTRKLSTYAERLSFMTGIDDELIRSNQAILLTFSELADSADEIGGPFDRAVVALLDLEAAGKKITAVQLGRALQDPAKNMTALRKAGILLTDAQKELITTYMEANNVVAAQDVLLDAIEKQVGGTAESTASATEKMAARFEDLGETLSDALLPTVDTLSEKFGDWIDSAEGKKAVDKLKDSLVEMGDWLASPKGEKALKEMADTLTTLASGAKEFANFLRDAKNVADSFTSGNIAFFDMLREWADETFNLPNYTPPSSTPNTPGLPTVADREPARVVVNFNAPVDSVSAGREVARVLSDYNRARGMGR